jgi:hypothetical protein
MYLKSDPRSALAGPSTAKAPQPTEFAGAEYAKFYETAPQDDDANGRTWYARGQNYVIAYSETKPGARFTRESQPDEYVVLLPDAATSAEISLGADRKHVAGYSIAFVPAGGSTLVVPNGGRVIRMFTTQSADLSAKCVNADAFATPHPNIPPFEPWPNARSHGRIHAYSLDVKSEEGRFGRIFRCSTFMVNYLEPRKGPRDVTKLSPHHHDDFEQCSLALEGEYIHDIRWPWIPDMTKWREDDHEYCAAPSIAVIPPPAIHTSRAVGSGVNQLVDIFCPPRMDFSSKPGWVVNADDYPMPGQS